MLYMKVVKRANPKSSPYKGEYIFSSISLILYLYEVMNIY